jgi:plastocyanin
MFQPTELVAKAGKVTIHFTNKSPENHDLSVQQGSNGTVLGSTGAFDGATKTLTVMLKPGKYTFFCNVPGHRASGMVGTIVVKG